MALNGHRVEAALLAHHREGGLEAAERLHVGVGADGFILRQNGEAVHVLHRHDRFAEAALGPGGSRLLVRGHGQRIHVTREKPYFVAIKSAATPCGEK